MSADENLEGIEQDEDTQVFDVGLFDPGPDNKGFFHTKNNPKDPYQRSGVIQRTGAVDIRCTVVDIVHGAMSPTSDFFATLMVLKFRFDPQKRARRIAEARIELEFDALSASAEIPIVEAISFDGNFSLLPSKQTESYTRGVESTVGASFGAELSVGGKAEKTVERETGDATTIAGATLEYKNIAPTRGAKWSVLENKTLKTGVPASLQVAVLIKRSDEEVFQCIPKLECKADKWTALETFAGSVPPDDPVLVKPDLPPTNKLMQYDIENLGSLDLQSLSDVTFTTMIMDAVKTQKAK